VGWHSCQLSPKIERVLQAAKEIEGRLVGHEVNVGPGTIRWVQGCDEQFCCAPTASVGTLTIAGKLGLYHGPQVRPPGASGPLGPYSLSG
jgi:hypothetical protein